MQFLRLFMTLVFFIGTVGETRSIEFIPEKVSAGEIDIWKTCYAGNLERKKMHLKSFLEQVYAIPDATKALFFYSEAMMLFNNISPVTPKEQYNETILPLLKGAFKKIKKTSSFLFNPDLLAEKEMEWWVARRTPHQYDHQKIGAIMAQSYALLYGGLSKTYEEAALFRAFAVSYRDKFEKLPEEIFEEDWEIIQNNLLISYKKLKDILEKDLIVQYESTTTSTTV
jgi:hypothetical protein